MKIVLKMSGKKAREYFLSNKSYFNLDLPKYFDFSKILKDVDVEVKGRDFKTLYSNDKTKRPNLLDDVNYSIMHNKNGKYAWRNYELINPFLYVNLVNIITEDENWRLIKNRFKEFQKNKKIICCSIPGEPNKKDKDVASSINRWWREVEQRTIKHAIDFDYIARTDISDCYPSIYTHTISWALHGKTVAKDKKTDFSYIGNLIDREIGNMSNGQTNGIPQGSSLMDFIAEMVLGYCDLKLSDEIKEIEDYLIIRYRDDYIILSNDISIINRIMKELTSVLSGLNLKLNSSKTMISDNVICNSIKSDKQKLLEFNKKDNSSLQKQLLNIRKFGLDYPNSGSLKVLLIECYKSKKGMKKLNKKPRDLFQMISIVVDIMYTNPSVYHQCTAILSKFFSLLSIDEREKTLKKIENKFKKLPNTDYLEVWLQRLSLSTNKDRKYNSELCKMVYDNSAIIWNNIWISKNLDQTKIINVEELDSVKLIIPDEEIDVFENY